MLQKYSRQHSIDFDVNTYRRAKLKFHVVARCALEFALLPLQWREAWAGQIAPRPGIYTRSQLTTALRGCKRICVISAPGGNIILCESIYYWFRFRVERRKI
ncbi:unnamed protein product, partial [Iphiclides podalirius]